MEQRKDTTKIELVSNHYEIKKNRENIFIIEQKKEIEKSDNTSNEALNFMDILTPVLISIIVFILHRLWYRKKEQKEKEKLELDIEKVREDISVLKKSFQPLVLSTIHKTQEKLLDDKINALKEIASFRYELFNVEQTYIDGTSTIEDIHQYNQIVFLNLNQIMINDLKNIAFNKAYLFPQKIIKDINLIIFFLTEILNIQKKQISLGKQEMPSEVVTKLDEVSKKLNEVIGNIRKDLHLDNSFIHDFVEKYKN